MPVTPSQNPSPFNTVNDALNAARVRLNDVLCTLYPTSGQVLKNTDAFSQQCANNAWLKMTEALRNLGYSAGTEEVIITELPTVGSLDPASQMWIDWSGCWDGLGFFTNPNLPVDLQSPIKVYERPTGQNACFCPMGYAFDGIPNASKQARNGVYQWRGNRIYMPGSTFSMDLRIEFNRRFVKFADDPANDTRWYEQDVPIVDANDAYSLYICLEYATGREDVTAELFQSSAEDAMRSIFNRDTRMKQRYDTRRQSRSGRLEGAWTGENTLY